VNSEYEGGGTWELGQEEWGGNYNNSVEILAKELDECRA